MFFNLEKKLLENVEIERVSHMRSGDLDGDGNRDLAVANYYARNVSVFLGVGDGTLQACADYNTGDAPRFVAAGDVDGDGCMECGACARNCPTAAVTVRPGVCCAAAVLREKAGGGGCCDRSSTCTG